MCRSRSAACSDVRAASWSTVEVCRSAACLAIVSGPRIAAGARSQPIRSPGASTFDSEEIVTVRSAAPACEPIGASGSPS